MFTKLPFRPWIAIPFFVLLVIVLVVLMFFPLHSTQKNPSVGTDTQLQEEVLEYVDSLSEFYDTLYTSRKVFDAKIAEFSSRAAPTVLHHPNHEQRSETEHLATTSKYVDTQLEENIVQDDLYIWVRYPKNYIQMDTEELFSNVSIYYKDELQRLITVEDRYFSDYYAYRLWDTTYYLLVFSEGGMRGADTILPVVVRDGSVSIGKVASGFDLSNYIDEKSTFIRDRMLYLVLDDPRQFGSYNASNNASLNPYVPRIYTVLDSGELLEIKKEFANVYQLAQTQFEKDLLNLEAYVNTQKEAGTRVLEDSIIPYFDYYYGIRIRANPTQSQEEIGRDIRATYTKIFGTSTLDQLHF
jgi:hypothetical protein